MDQSILYLGISLLALVTINIILGSVSSLFQQQFDKTKLFQGIIKGLVVTACFVAVIYVGKLTPNIIVINVNGINVDLFTATHMLMLSSYIFYGKEVLVKLSSFVSGKYKTEEIAITENKSITEEK